MGIEGSKRKISLVYAVCNSFSETLDLLWVGILPAQIRTGKMPIPQDFQIKLHIALVYDLTRFICEDLQQD